VCVWQSAPPRRETNNALKREPLELELNGDESHGDVHGGGGARRRRAVQWERECARAGLVRPSVGLLTGSPLFWGDALLTAYLRVRCLFVCVLITGQRRKLGLANPESRTTRGG
jgi:hypothetical protein